jgi:hypothetical protein
MSGWSKRTSRRLLVAACVVAGLVDGARSTRAQVPRIRYISGQNVQPVFEGWEPQRDGTFNLVFGYLNRNLGEDLSIPVGSVNSIEPGGPDRGQPTFFYAGRQEFVFRVHVPKDFGKNELVWTLTVRGQTQEAFGSLLPVWQIDRELVVSRTVPAARLDTVNDNQPPTLVVDPVSAVTLPGTATLRALVTDDGIPGPKPPRPQRQPAQGNAPVFLNAPLPAPPAGPPSVLSLAWIQYRGPGKVSFDPSGYTPVKSGEKTTATARFSEPGTYELRAIAHDSILQTTHNFTVTVTGPPSSQR